MEKLRKYKLYHIKFYDHLIGDDEEIIVDAVGYFIKSSSNYLTFSHWLIESDEWKDDNLEPFSLFKSAIIQIKELKSRGRLQ